MRDRFDDDEDHDGDDRWSYFPCDFFFNMMRDLYDINDDERNEDGQNDRSTPFGGPIGDILGHLFHSSSYDEYYED